MPEMVTCEDAQYALDLVKAICTQVGPGCPGSPSAFDRCLATRFGGAVARLALEGKVGQMVAMQNGQMVDVSLEEALARVQRQEGVPHGAGLITSDPGHFPTVQVENVYVLPGIPEIFEAKIASLRDRFASQPYHLRQVLIAASEGRINLSPKGLADTFRVLAPDRVAFLDLGGSGNETNAHLIADGRITIMMCNFQQPALILRIYGHGKPVLPADPEWDDCRASWPAARAIPWARARSISAVRSIASTAPTRPTPSATPCRPAASGWSTSRSRICMTA